ncbi:YopX family protein [Enterococcus villorum]|uniref:YopX family protein n=2 Tax=Enterococcus villorum TaxID=112904 RepID=UPI0035E74EA7
MIPKFRAWYTPFKGEEFGQEMKYGQAGSLITHAEMSPDKYVLMQSTGLKDKNGVEIFEGDIVQWGDTADWEEEPIRVAVVKINPDIQFDSNVGIFEYGQFAFRDTERFLTVLGNIYENSELLEVE